MLAAFRPQSLRVRAGERWIEIEGYLALLRGGKGPSGCEGIFHPRMIQLAAGMGKKEGGTVGAGEKTK